MLNHSRGPVFLIPVEEDAWRKGDRGERGWTALRREEERREGQGGAPIFILPTGEQTNNGEGLRQLGEGI